MSRLTRATHYFTTFLESQPHNSLPDYCQPAREIFIENDEDGYAWGQRWSGTEDVLNPEIHLGTDTYIWGDCLYPIDGWYTHVSSLQAKHHPDVPATTPWRARPALWGGSRPAVGIAEPAVASAVMLLA